MQAESRICNASFRVALPLLSMMVYAGSASAFEDPPKLMPAASCSPRPAHRVYSAKRAVTLDVNSNPKITADINAVWAASTTGVSTPCAPVSGSTSSWTCAGMTVAMPSTATSTTPEFVGPPSSAVASHKLRVSGRNGATTCTEEFTFRSTTEETFGWGDPHLTTVDGVHYDFQSAGEFTTLREDGFEVQTRQSPVPTATVPITNEYTGITHCVAIYTAVAAKLGSSRVTVQPSPGAEPDPNSMQVRVNGSVVTLGNTPLILFAENNDKGAIEGTLTKHPDGVYEITDARGTQLVVTTKYWDARKVWYLNINVYGTSAHQGTLGVLGDRSWLPALPDGTSLGARPESEPERYKVLYETFADAWRVTKETSLFDYEDYGAGVGTETYTRDEWPRLHPDSCAIGGEESAQGVAQEVAEQACANVVNAVRRADCVFDVMITGNEGFGQNAVVAQRFNPLPPGWYSPVPSKPIEPCAECPKCTECPKVAERPWWCWIMFVFGLVQLALIIFLVLRARKRR